MPRVTANGIEIEYDAFGDSNQTPLLLVMGLSAQLIAWEEGFCKMLADHGYYVIRFDNRDCGLSTHFDGAAVDMGAVVNALLTGDPPPPVPYNLSDMAADSIGLLDALGIERAHIVGASMGGMIVQTMAIEHPNRVLTMTSIMSTTGEHEYGQPEPDAAMALLTPPPTDRAGYVDGSVSNWHIFGSPRYFDPDKQASKAAEAFDRAFYPEGVGRQLAAVMSSGSRADALRALSVPTLVIHGRADRLITLSGGERTAELVPGANLVVLHDAGHDLPEPLWPFITTVIATHIAHGLA